ncbi:MAG: hypothetical protein LBV17_12440 [Treponema sp.]|jgi:hypothetical protein|nr:hypothetical protein [Treponema sp.]
MKKIYWLIIIFIFSINILYGKDIEKIPIGDTGYHITIDKDAWWGYWSFRDGSDHSILWHYINYKDDNIKRWVSLIIWNKYFDLNNAYILNVDGGGEHDSDVGIIYFNNSSLSVFDSLKKFKEYNMIIMNKNIIFNVFHDNSYGSLVAEAIISESNNIYIHIIVNTYGGKNVEYVIANYEKNNEKGMLKRINNFLTLNKD